MKRKFKESGVSEHLLFASVIQHNVPIPFRIPSPMRAYVQQGQPGDHSYPNWEQIAYGFWERGYEVIRFDIPQLDDGFLDTWLLKYLDETIVGLSDNLVSEKL